MYRIFDLIITDKILLQTQKLEEKSEEEERSHGNRKEQVEHDTDLLDLLSG